MANELKNAKIIATGKVVQVYRHTSGGWVDWSDCKTIYKENEVQLI